MKALGSYKCFRPICSHLFIVHNSFLCYVLSILSVSGRWFIKFSEECVFVFPNPETPIISILQGKSGILANLCYNP